MTAPRSQLVDSATPGFFHCMSRCVRRAFLCGEDSYTGRSFEHRKQWVEDRLIELADCFAVGLYAYAVMSNHLHVVLFANPLIANEWTADEVAERWMRLFPVRVHGEVDPEGCHMRAQALTGNAVNEDTHSSLFLRHCREEVSYSEALTATACLAP
jgi:hypothetical protein